MLVGLFLEVMDVDGVLVWKARYTIDAGDEVTTWGGIVNFRLRWLDFSAKDAYKERGFGEHVVDEHHVCEDGMVLNYGHAENFTD